MTHVKAREWIKRIPEGRGRALDAGSKAVLQELWDRVDWSITHSVDGRRCYPTRKRIAEEIGATTETVKRRLVILSEAGWIKRDGNGWALSWGAPFGAVHAGESTTDTGESTTENRSQLPAHAGESTTDAGESTTDTGESTTRVPSHDQDRDQNQRRAPAPGPTSTPTPSGRESIERQLLALVLAKGVAGTAPGASFVAPMVERVEDGCTVEDVGRVIDEWKRRRDMGDRAQGRLSALFYLRSWTRTRIEYLNERPTAARALAARAPSIADEWAEFERQGQPA